MPRLGFMGFGEAGHDLSRGFRAAGVAEVFAYDIAAADRPEDFARRAAGAGVELVDSPAGLAQRADLIISVVTCDRAVEAAASISPFLGAGHLYADHNSTSPQVKQQVAAQISASGARFVEVAMMDLVRSRMQGTPMLLCGEAAAEMSRRLAPFGTDMKVVGTTLGAASATKMFRSIMVKGMASLVIECLQASRHLGVQRTVFDTLNASFPGLDWHDLASRLMANTSLHCLRQSHEMDEVCATMEALGETPIMAKASARRLAALAALGSKEHFGDTPP
jgi:3-hydroxyisobutyrate dehydrogenase